jgi:hypothetical protein
MTTPYAQIVERWQQRDGDDIQGQRPDAHSLGQMLEDARAIHARILARLLDKTLLGSATTTAEAPEGSTP